MTATPRPVIRRDEAEQMASQHRGAFGDDVVLHDAEDFGNFFACEDCDWLVVYVPHYRLTDDDLDEVAIQPSGDPL